MAISTSLLNSEDPEYRDGRIIAEIQRLTARLDELEQEVTIKDQNLLDLQSKPQARRNIGIPDGATSTPYLVWGANGWRVGDINTASTLEDLTDVTISALTTGDVLSYNGTAWINLAQSALVISYNDLTDVPATFPSTWTLVTGKPTTFTPINHDLDSTYHPDVSVTAAADGEGLVYDTGLWVNKPVVHLDAGSYTIDDGTLQLQGGQDIIFNNPSAAASSNSGVGWAYSATRYAAWTYFGSKVILGDGPTGSSPDGTNPIEYTPSATDGSRSLDVDVELTLQGTAGTTGQAIIADANGKPEWATLAAASLDLGTEVIRSSGTTWAVPSTARTLLVVCIGGGGGGSVIGSGSIGFVATSSGGSPTREVFHYAGSGGNGADAAMRFFSVSGSETATISIGSGGAGSSSGSGASGGTTSFIIGSDTCSAAGGIGGQQFGVVTANQETSTEGNFSASGQFGSHLMRVAASVSVSALEGGSPGARFYDGSLLDVAGKGGDALQSGSGGGTDGEQGQIWIYHDG